MPEQPDDRRQHEADQAHEHELAHAGQAARGGRPVERQAAEHSRRHHERRRDRGSGVCEHEHRQRHTRQRRIAEKDGGRRAGRQPVRARRQVEDESELPDEQADDEHVVADQRLEQRRRAGDHVGDDAGDREPRAHPPVHRAKEGSDSLGGRNASGKRGRGIPVKGVHTAHVTTRGCAMGE